MLSKVPTQENRVGEEYRRSIEKIPKEHMT